MPVWARSSIAMAIVYAGLVALFGFEPASLIAAFIFTPFVLWLMNGQRF